MSGAGFDPSAINEELHIGWKDDGSALLLDFKRVWHHGVILAGSGAGKSTVVGRIVEEILIKTLARVVVIDTNGDFRKAHLIADKNGEEGEVWKVGPPPPGDIFFNRDSFEERWRSLKMIQLTYADSNAPTNGVEWATPFVSWNKLPVPWQMDVLGLELGRNPYEVAALYRVSQRLGDEDALDVPISPRTVETELRLLAATSSTNNPLDERTAIALQMRCRRAAQFPIWRVRPEDLDLSCWFKTKTRPRLCTFDVPSVGDQTSANILVALLLELVWEVAQTDWDEAVADPANDTRVPLFVVIDEAHNFVPKEDLVDPYALRISQYIQRIAAEGRKYGLYLLLATQRPSKVRPGLLSECENVCLLRIRSPVERELAVDTWGMPEEYKLPTRSPLAEYKKGEGLLFGNWVKWTPTLFKGGRRRTKATGGDLPDTNILKRAP